MFVKIKEIWNKYKREVIVGVVVSLITAVLLEGSNWFIETAPRMGDTLFDTVKNIICACAATQSNLHIFSSLITCGLGILISYYLINVMKLISAYKQIKKLQKIDKYLKEDTSDDIELKEKLNREFSELYKDTLEKGKNTNKILYSKVKTVLTVFILSMFAMIVYIFLFILVPISMVDKFQKDITVITPYSDERTIQKLESDWVCMRSENEFIEIYDVIHKIKQENNLQ